MIVLLSTAFFRDSNLFSEVLVIDRLLARSDLTTTILLNKLKYRNSMQNESNLMSRRMTLTLFYWERSHNTVKERRFLKCCAKTQSFSCRKKLCKVSASTVWSVVVRTAWSCGGTSCTVQLKTHQLTTQCLDSSIWIKSKTWSLLTKSTSLWAPKFTV